MITGVINVYTVACEAWRFWLGALSPFSRLDKTAMLRRLFIQIIIRTLTVTYGTLQKNKRSSVLNLPKQRQVCPSLFFQFNMRISVIYGTLSVSYKPVVSVLSPLASNSCGGSHMVTNIPAPDHLDELLGHFSFFFKDQRKNDVSDFESDTMTSFRTTSASHWRANTYGILSYDRTNFLNMMHLHFDFTFNGKPL